MKDSCLNLERGSLIAKLQSFFCLNHYVRVTYDYCMFKIFSYFPVSLILPNPPNHPIYSIIEGPYFQLRLSSRC